MPTLPMPADAPIGCPTPLLRTIFHNDPHSYCRALIFAGLKLKVPAEEALAIARQDMPVLDAAAEKMVERIYALHETTYREHSHRALSVAEGIVGELRAD